MRGAKGRRRPLRALCDTNDLSRFCTKSLFHAELRNYPSRFKSEVSVMVKRILTEQERLVTAIVTQKLNEMIETKLTVAEIMDAAAESAQRRKDDAIILQWT